MEGPGPEQTLSQELEAQPRTGTVGGRRVERSYFFPTVSCPLPWAGAGWPGGRLECFPGAAKSFGAEILPRSQAVGREAPSGSV